MYQLTNNTCFDVVKLDYVACAAESLFADPEPTETTWEECKVPGCALSGAVQLW